MFRNYLRIALRNLRKNKTVTFINIFGLMTGITCCLLIGLYITNELSFDNFQQKGNRIGRVIMSYRFTSGDFNSGNFTSTKVFPAFKKNFPEVESGVRMQRRTMVISAGDRQFDEKGVMFADSTFFDLFSFKLLRGDPAQVISGLDKIVLTQSSAKKYFGEENPVGKILKVGSSATPYQVTGIIEDCPPNSQISFDFLASFSSLGETQEETYWDANYTTYLLLKDEKSFATIKPKIEPFMRKEMQGQGATVNFSLEPFKDIHLHSEYEGFVPNTSITYIYILGAVALLILAIACFTYINLSTARSMERAREVGIRKVTGAHKKQIFAQFIAESALLSLIALVLSIGVVAAVMPAFNSLTGKLLSISSLFSTGVIGTALFVTACIGLLAGSYPAFILSNFRPVKVLKGSFKNTASGIWLRKTLMVFQFVISVFLIIASFVIQGQLHYIQNKDLGYNRDHILVLPLDDKILASLPTIKTEFTANPNIKTVCRAQNLPTEIVSGYNMRSATMNEGDQMAVTANSIDEDYIKTVGVHIIAGSDFTKQDLKDVAVDDRAKKTYHFILNESAAKALGWTPQQAVGKKMFLDESRPGTVKGVVKDFNFLSLHSPIKPLVLFTEAWGRNMLVKVTGNNMPQTITYLESKWKELVPYRPFEYHFLDEDYNRLYTAEIRLGRVMNLFAAIAIILACTGLFGLSSYAVQQRVKEIGVRKVLGASVFGITALLSKDFLKLVIAAFVIASPVAWFALNKWLQGYSYRITMQWWVFAAAGVLLVLIAVITVSFRTIKAAVANPVKALRSE
ncbi:MAG TPA: ABC transporter permease [Chitinophagaceae bacterium]|nr:ABC transporter permease [Chitinophagaceae bacterium]